MKTAFEFGREGEVRDPKLKIRARSRELWRSR
jgi:hypothetical protein